MAAEKPTLENIISLADFEAQAESCMSAMAFAYVAGGAADELTMRANCEDWKRILLAPRILVDVSEISLRTEVLGKQLEMPIMMATVAGANQAGGGLILSSFSTVAVEEVTASAKHPVWFQLYF